MSKKNTTKLLTYSNSEVKEIIETYARKEATERNISVSRVIEEWSLRGIILDFPNMTDTVQAIFSKRYPPLNTISEKLD